MAERMAWWDTNGLDGLMALIERLLIAFLLILFFLKNVILIVYYFISP